MDSFCAEENTLWNLYCKKFLIYMYFHNSFTFITATAKNPTFKIILLECLVLEVIFKHIYQSTNVDIALNLRFLLHSKNLLCLKA